ncbi:MAG: 30S ribosome-binding factor RbfA [Deltaproteobacteria bacterium]|nr:30S ribosome-binding factor RbfA [Deltaproteobacteria bacterium]
MENKRPQRVADQLLHEVARAVQHDVKDPRVGFVTFTSARVSPDLRVAWIYYTVLGDEKAREGTRRGLESATPFLRRTLGQALRLKSVPELRFDYDDAVERGLRMEELLGNIRDDAKPTDR